MKLNIVAVISFVCAELWNELWLTPMMFYSFARIWSDPVWNKWTRQSVPAWLQPFSPTSMRANMNRNKNSPQHRLTFATSTSWSITVAATARLHKHVFTEKKNYQQNNTRSSQCIGEVCCDPTQRCLFASGKDYRLRLLSFSKSSQRHVVVSGQL